ASGYAAGYYSYLYSEVIAAWVSEWFEDHGGLDRKAGDAFREAILAPGFSIDPMSAIERFFGTRPDVAPLLRRRGLAEPVASEDEPADEDAPGGPDTEAGDPAPTRRTRPPTRRGRRTSPSSMPIMRRSRPRCASAASNRRSGSSTMPPPRRRRRPRSSTSRSGPSPTASSSPPQARPCSS